jgi:hypothetical protein
VNRSSCARPPTPTPPSSCPIASSPGHLHRARSHSLHLSVPPFCGEGGYVVGLCFAIWSWTGCRLPGRTVANDIVPGRIAGSRACERSSTDTAVTCSAWSSAEPLQLGQGDSQAKASLGPQCRPGSVSMAKLKLAMDNQRTPHHPELLAPELRSMFRVHGAGQYAAVGGSPDRQTSWFTGKLVVRCAWNQMPILKRTPVGVGLSRRPFIRVDCAVHV